MKLRHVIEAQQFDRSILEENIFPLTGEMERVAKVGKTDALSGKILSTLFYEPSSRTRLSFEAAMLKLGGGYIGESDPHYSSRAKGENLRDTILTVNCYADVIALRQTEEGMAAKVAEFSAIPIINAGDGAGQHPTQSLLDLYTIQKELGRIDGITVSLVGDLKHGRTVRSLAYLLGKFEDVKIHFVAGTHLQIKDDILDYLARHRVHFDLVDDLTKVIAETDILYMTRLQKERATYPATATSNAYHCLDESLVARLKSTARILHPFPRNEEIPEWIDADPRAAYIRQIQNGLYLRMALLYMLLT